MSYLPKAPWVGAGGFGCAFLRLALPIVLTLLLASVANAKTPDRTLSLSTALERTLGNSPSLNLYAFRKEALEGAAVTANLRPAYEVEIEAENFGGSGETEAFDSAELTLSLSSVLEFGDKRGARSDLVSTTHSMIDTQLQLESLEVLAEVTRSFIETLASQARVELSNDAVRLAEETLATVQKRASAGATSQAEVSRAQSSLAMTRLILASEVQHLESLKLSLAALWGEQTPNFDRVIGDLFQFGNDKSLDALYGALERNPAITMFADQERLNDSELRLARTQSKSDLGWSVGIRHIRETEDTALVAGLSMPLSSARRNTGEISRLRSERNAIAVQREADILKLRALLFGAYNSRQHAKLAVTQLKTSVIPSLEEALKQTRKGYQRGRFSYLDYISVSKELLESKRMLIESAAAVLTYGAEIEQLSADSLNAERFIPNNETLGVAK